MTPQLFKASTIATATVVLCMNTLSYTGKMIFFTFTSFDSTCIKSLPVGRGRLWFCLTAVFVLQTLCTVNVLTVAHTSSDVVEVNSLFGRIQGARKTNPETGESYVIFQGIPYAQPPVGELRFQKPLPHPPLDAVFDATKDDIIECPQPASPTSFTEDCLVLRIEAKDTDVADGESLKKVLVFIHGGAFVLGSAYEYSSKSFVLSHDVIVVKINYRLGVLGFLCTQDEASPGNYGLWDQTLALRWVKDNIKAFGGDPDDVTIAGESAGGASVGFQMITPHTKGLFSKAYPQSGSATAPFASSANPLPDALTIAKKVGCWDKEPHSKPSVEESRSVVQCLREIPVSTLAGNNTFSFVKSSFVPVIDADFIHDNPQNLLKDEAYLESIGFFDRSYLIAINNAEDGFVDLLQQAVKQSIYMNNETSEEEKEDLWLSEMKAIKENALISRLGEKFASDVNIKNTVDDFYARRFADNESSLVAFDTDLQFLIPSLDYVIAASKRPSCHAYYLIFSHFPSCLKGPYRGTDHALDLPYWFDMELSLFNMFVEGEMDQDDLKLKVIFSSLVADFIKTGNPGVSLNNHLSTPWPPYDTVNARFLTFNLSPWVSSFPGKDQQDLWFKTIPALTGAKPDHIHTEL